MHVAFVHTPMPHRKVPGRPMFWRNFDLRYHITHPESRLMKRYMWELPHWVTWLAGVLENEGFRSMEVLDFYTDHSILDGIDAEGIRELLRYHEADVYLFSPMTPNLPHALQIADIVKELYPKSKVVLGGIVATPLHREVIGHPNVDYVVLDRGEYALPDLLRALRGEIEIESVGNLAYKGPNKEPVINSKIYPLMPVSEIPFPKVDIFPKSVGDDIRYIRQVHALGCPYQCDYCSIQTIGRMPSYFSTTRVISEIRAYREHYGSHHHVYFGDETFTLHVAKTLEICDALKEEGNVIYDCQTRLNCLQDERLYKALFDSGCRWVEIGIESANQSSLDLTHKRGKIKETEKILTQLRDAGIPACSFMVVGFPNETADDMKRTIEWACSLLDRGLLHASYLFGLVPYPGTPMFHKPEQFGLRLRHRNYEFYHEDLLPVYDTNLLSAEQMYDVFLQGVNDIGEAMGRKPYLGDNQRIKDASELYGGFWRENYMGLGKVNTSVTNQQ